MVKRNAIYLVTAGSDLIETAASYCVQKLTTYFRCIDDTFAIFKQEGFPGHA